MKLTEKVEAWLAKSNDFESLFQQFNLEFGPRPNFLDKLPPQVSTAKPNITVDVKSYIHIRSLYAFFVRKHFNNRCWEIAVVE